MQDLQHWSEGFKAAGFGASVTPHTGAHAFRSSRCADKAALQMDLRGG